MLGNGAGESGLFQSTRPLRGGTFRLGLGTMNCKFQSTRPLRGGTTKFVQMVITSRFQSTRPLRGGTAGHDSAELVTWISIHPPLAGRDPDDVQGQPLFADFNPPAPCGAGPLIRYWAQMEMQFQSTRPLRGGTILRGAAEDARKISIHPPLAGRDYDVEASHAPRQYFNPPAPCGAGRSGRLLRRGRRDFNPPAPCGAGQVKIVHRSTLAKFQSTRPLRGGTAILHKKTVQNIAYCTKSAFTLAVLSGFLALMRPFFCQTCTNFGANLPKNRCSLPVRTLIPSGPPPADSRH